MTRRKKQFDILLKRLQEPRRFIQCLIGPRQVGKTTLARQVSEALKIPCLYVSADLATLQDLTWLQQQWDIARELVRSNGKALLIVDESRRFLIGPK
jgi:predicted AAA+ superfamily ATPase